MPQTVRFAVLVFTFHRHQHPHNTTAINSYGVILQREAHEYFKFLPDAVPASDANDAPPDASGSSKVKPVACHIA